jgi:type II secretory pathway pseudopilin PulG
MDRISVKKNNFGFTLTELLVIVTIILILLVMAFIAYRSQIAKGYDARRKTDLHQIKVGLEEYEKDHECYPPRPLGCGPDTALDPYMGGQVPCDPATGAAYEYFPDNSSSCPGWFWIFTDLDYEEDPAVAEIGCVTGCGPSASETDYNYYTSSPNAPDVYVAPYPLYGCMPGNTCQGMLNNKDKCDPNYPTLEACEAACAGATTYCDKD